ncbi:unnamed protein product, partial [marine sediment metagenome]
VNKMEINNQDLKILNILYKNKSLTAYEITRRMFPKLNSDGIRAKTNSIKYRLKRLIELNLIIEEKEDNTNYYSIVKENVQFTRTSQASSPKRTIDLGMGFWIRRNSDWEILNFKE